jgi:hypothetical protein
MKDSIFIDKSGEFHVSGVIVEAKVEVRGNLQIVNSTLKEIVNNGFATISTTSPSEYESLLFLSEICTFSEPTQNSP